MDEPYDQTSTCITPNYIHYEDANLGLHLYCDNISLINASLVLSIAFLGLCFSVYGLYSVVKTDRLVSVYVLNLFICDLVQTSATLIEMSEHLRSLKRGRCNHMLYDIMMKIYNIGLVINICFMVCISADRYLMIAYPVWYRTVNRMRKVFVSITIWITTAFLTIIVYISLEEYLFLCALLVLILPYPLVIIFLVGTWRALSRNTTIPPRDQRQIMATLALVLFIYTVLFLPCTVKWFDIAFPSVKFGTSSYYLWRTADTLTTMNPLFDFLLYLVMRKDAKHILSALFFCFHKRHVENSTTDTVTEAQV